MGVMGKHLTIGAGGMTFVPNQILTEYILK
jgi:hypothetical protein